jgi:uncharacterized protein YrrD
MKISIGADVAARGARVGKVRRVILDPETFDIQRIIIERLAGAGEALIPADKIYEATEELVTIDLSADEIYALPAFEDEGYIPLAQLERDPSALPFSPIEPALIPFSFVPSATAPENVSPPLSPEPATDPRSRAVRAGMEVYAGNHKVGEIREVIFDGSDKRLVSFVIERGWFFSHDVEIPADFVSVIEDDRIVLNRSKQQIEELDREQHAGPPDDSGLANA